MKREQGLMRQIGLVLILVMLSVVVLSAAGIYALTSSTLARRRREIGHPRRARRGSQPLVLAGIFARALGQLGLGAAVGLVGAIGVDAIIEGDMFQGQGAVICAGSGDPVHDHGSAYWRRLGPPGAASVFSLTEALREE